ncbi:glycine-rich protein [Streptomyces viridiviolaceus]|uniref:Uncharacterized protein n=1 Tax=Streptomyces viridiviolaceus TaxID=68282 RepID=A0ABW2EB83_9ACTN|nr:hypothetical protein [Streptomyces viridiviolaceus]GHB67964.1 glycine-rich protein [Streptomyces viridiviolaceus]
MSDDDSPDNVRHLPRIGAGPPPPVPPSPALDGDGDGPDEGPGTVRISAFDAPQVPYAPQSADSVPAALRSDGLDGTRPVPDAGPPRTGALSLAAILAIALAAFEGLQTWIQESGPRRAEASAHQRELELLAAKANADATRHRAETDRENARSRRVPSSHEYGRSALGRGSGGSGRGGGGIGAGRSVTGRTGPFSGSTQQRSPGPGGRMNNGSGRSGTGRNGSGSSAGGTGSGRNGGGSSRNGGSPGRSDASWRRNGGAGSRNSGSGGSGSRGTGSPGGSGSGRGDTASAGSGRRTARQTIADWWGKGKKTSGGSGSTPGAKNSGGDADKRAAVREAAKRTRSGPTFWDTAGDRAKDRWKRRPGTDTGGTAAGGARDTSKAPRTGNDGWTAPGDRVGFRDAVFDAMADRWKKRRERWSANGGPRPRRPGTPGSSDSRRKKEDRPGPSESSRPSGRPGQSAGTGPTGPDTDAGPGFGQARSSPFDADTGPSVTITVEQVDPPGAHAKRWEPDAIGPPQPALPRQGPPPLPRAPQRPAGPRPGTTRRKEPIPMPPVPARNASVPAPVAASVPAPSGMSAQHATEITLDDALKALTLLTTAGMETHDECADLAKQARRLLGELETMAQDLAVAHNVTGPRTLRAAATLIETVAQLVVQSERMARAALDAAETAEAEETAMARDYRPTQAATADAGLATPSARIHNEN